MAHRMRSAVLAAVVLGCLVGCASQSGQAIESDAQMSDELLRMSRQGEAGSLADLTSFAWEDVYLYFEGASAEDIADDVGSELKMNDYYYSAGCLTVPERVRPAVRT